ncbi:nicotinamide mononucleotide transporter [Bacterioplanes sanyensis]|uniref:nicotinamide riboside transporter PnuC n=1 Tax=Bacterioplanes sanyensis TaxID=1249553 RepID=UPI0016750BDA|nr:nicotinamide riboside transporter PnuC [Bacterioplanes sanyensis]GGY49270.1 nicotinamide mononucleotide transporter [Bacterioplanes sanyensis]
MESIWQGVLNGAAVMSPWEVVAVALGIAYLVLAMRQSNWCWYAAFGSTAIFSWLFWDVSLVMESALNVYYLAMAIYGWWVWRSGATANRETRPVVSWAWPRHLGVIALVLALTLVSGFLLERNTNAALPYLDSFTTWGSVITTFMVARKVLENWLYWQVFNSCAIVLYLDRELYLTAVLMAVYLVLAVIGWFMWRRDFHQQAEMVAA